MKQAVRLLFHTSQTDESPDEVGASRSSKIDRDPYPLEIRTDGFYVEDEDGDTIHIEYDLQDGEYDFIDHCEIRFKRSDPGLIWMIKGTGIGSIMALEKGRVHDTVYATPFGSIDLKIYTRDLDNRIEDGHGTLTADYVLRFGTSSILHNRLSLEIS